MQFQVPQFIDTEAKIVGPLTLKQFLVVAGAAGVSVLGFYILQIWLWIIVTLLVGGIAVGIAFVKVNGRPLLTLIKSMFRYAWEPKFYLWAREPQKEPSPGSVPLPSRAPGASSLQNLFLKLTTTTEAITKRELPSALQKMKSGMKSAGDGFEVLRKSTGEREAIRRVDYR